MSKKQFQLFPNVSEIKPEEVTLKSILLPLTSQTADQHVMRIAGQFAFQFRATLKALFVRADPRSAVPFMGEGLTADMIKDLSDATEREGLAQANVAFKNYSAIMEDLGVHLTETAQKTETATARWQVAAGQISDYIGRRARTADLAICAQPNSDVPDSQDIFHDLIFRSGRPVMIVPEKCSEAPGRHIIIAWNGRAEGARAIGAALPLLWSAEKVTLLQIGDPDPDRPTLEDAADYLKDHGVSPLLEARKKGSKGTGEEIHAAAKDLQADMIVIGAYSHSRWREMILGGVTRHLIGKSELPVFMSH